MLLLGFRKKNTAEETMSYIMPTNFCMLCFCVYYSPGGGGGGGLKYKKGRGARRLA